MTQLQIENFIMTHPVSGGCGSTSKEDAEAAKQSVFTASLVSQAGQVFGADSSVFNTMKNSYGSVANAGPSQQGFSAAQQSEMDAAAITSGATATRGIEAMLGGKQAGAGGGNAPNSSGIGIDARAGVAEKIAGETAGTLNQIQEANWAQGNKNYEFAAEGLQRAPGVFSNMPGMDSAAQTGLDKNMANAQAADAASNWWVKPVMGAVGGGLNMLAPGAGLGSGFGAGTGQSGRGGGSSLQQWTGGSIGNTPDNALSSPQYMPGNGPAGPTAPNFDPAWQQG